MTWFEAVVLGVVQGLTEFLPVSSSAHLRIVAAMVGWDDPGAAFTAVSQLGTETAVLVYFRRDIWRIIVAWSRSVFDGSAWTAARTRRQLADTDARMGWLVIIGSIPIVLLGLLFQDAIDGVFRDLRLTAATLIVFGLLLGFADRAGPKIIGLDKLTVKHGLGYGFAQALALIPGVSRSGGTITAGLLMNYNRPAAARYAFLLAVPAVLASGCYKLLDIGKDGNTSWGPTIVGTVIAFGVGWAVIAWLMRFITTRSFVPFVVYRVCLGVLIIALVSVGVLDPAAGPVS